MSKMEDTVRCMIDDMKCKVHIYFFREVENQKGECVCVWQVVCFVDPWNFYF